MTDKEYFTREEFVNMVEAYNEAEKERQELKAENERLKEELKSLDRLQKLDHSYVIRYRNLLSKYVDKYKQTLQEIKKLAEVGQDKYYNGLILAKPILDLITKAESEE